MQNLAPAPIRRSARAAPRRRPLARLAAAGIVSLGLAAAFVPAYAQRPDGAPGIQTPFGRAPLTFADIVERVRPAVVSVSISSGGSGPKVSGGGGKPGRGGQLFPDMPEDHPLYDFFRRLPRDRDGGGRGLPTPRVQSQGSGFIISPDGYVVTNNHVVENAGRIQVSFDENTKHDAELIGTDQRTDLALLKIKGGGTFPYVKISSKSPRVGDWVLAVGNPFGFGGTVTAGIVSALGREVGTGPYDFMQIDAAVNKGNSGGPTFNLEGEVVGVNTAIYSPSGGNVGIAFAIPAKTINDVVGQLIKTGRVARGWLGVEIRDVDSDMAASLGLTPGPNGKAPGAFIAKMNAGGPAEHGGMKEQDVVMSVNGTKIIRSRDLAQRIAELAPGTQAAIEVIRDGQPKTLSVKLGTFPSSNPEVASNDGRPKPGRGPTTEGADIAQLGLTLSPGRGGLQITDVSPNSDAAEKGLKQGDVLLEIGGMPVQSSQDVQAAMKRVADLGRPAVMLRVRSGDQVRHVPVRLQAGRRN